MGQDKYVAYVGTYTHGSSIGIHVYDLDVEEGHMKEREVVPVNNASHITKSNNGKYLYSIADEGVVMDGIFHKGLGSVAERNFRPHVSCATPTPDGKYLCVVDNGIDQIKLYTVHPTTGKLKLYDIVRCKLESGPRLLRFSQDGRFAYVICELSNEILVYSYDGAGKSPQFDLIQKVSTVMDDKEGGETLYSADQRKVSEGFRGISG